MHAYAYHRAMHTPTSGVMVSGQGDSLLFQRAKTFLAGLVPLPSKTVFSTTDVILLFCRARHAGFDELIAVYTSSSRPTWLGLAPES